MLPRIRHLASRLGADVAVTGSVRELEERAARTSASGVARLVVAGGDGSIHHVLPYLAGTRCALGVVPLGNGNDLAGALGLPHDLDEALDVAIRGDVRQIDLGRAGDRYYATVAGIGLDGDVAGAVDRGLRWVRGPVAYPVAVVRALAGFLPPHLRVIHDSGTFDGPTMLAVLANGTRFGGGMKIAPHARADDGRLDLVIVRGISRLRVLVAFPRLYTGRHLGHPAVTWSRTRQATVYLESRRAVYADGEFLFEAGPGAVRFESVPAALGVAVPQGATAATAWDLSPVAG